MSKLMVRKFKELKLLLHKGWCKGSNAQDRRGSRTDPKKAAAVSWCLQGGCKRVCKGLKTIDWLDMVDVLEEALPKRPVITDWNDKPSRTKDQVIKLIDKVLEGLENG